MINTTINNFKIRFAVEEDIKLIFSFIKELAAYEKMTDEVIADEKTLYQSLFKKKAAEVIIGEFQGKPVGFALFFHNFSTFIGKPGIYLEDLYVKPNYRGQGFGKALLSYIASLAKQRDCGRVEWSCLNWNKPSIEFYKSLGAKPMDEWTVYRLSGKTLENLAKQSKN